MTPNNALQQLIVATVTVRAGCGAGPDYPPDWPSLRSPQREIKSASCPDLSGNYALPKAVKARVMKNTVLSEHTLRIESDYVCRGSWISDAKSSHTRADPPRFYARDVDGRLVGHTAYSAGGMVFMLSVIPVPAFVDDRAWWRLDPLGTAGQ